MFTRMKENLLAAARGPHALRALAAISFIESSVFPIPPDVMLIPMVIAHRKRAFVIAAVATVGSVVGGMFGYAIGYFAWQTIGLPLLGLFYGETGVLEKFAEFEARVQAYGFGPHFLAVFGAGLTPFPYKVITIASGALNIGLPAFVSASILSRGIRFFAEAALLYAVGDGARDFIERRFGMIVSGFFVLLVVGFVALRFMH